MFHHISGSSRRLLLNDTLNMYFPYMLQNGIRNGLYFLCNNCSRARLSTRACSRRYLNRINACKNVSAGFSSKPLNGRHKVFPIYIMSSFSRNGHDWLRKSCVLYNSVRNFSEQIDISGQGWLYKGLYDSPPVLYAQELLLNVHDISGMPWWATIIVSTMVLRTTITFPLALYQNYILAKLEIIQLQLKEISREMGKETSLAVKKFNWTERQAKAIYIRSMKKQWRELIVKENCHPAKASLLVLVQLPLWVSLSLSLRNLVLMLPTPDPVAQVTAWELSGGGVLWFNNLLLSDTTWIIPIMMGLVNLTIIEVQTLSRTKQSGKFQKILTNIFRGISIVMIPLAASVPSCLSLYWLTSSTVGLIHNLILLSPRVRRFVGIPQTTSVPKQPYKHIYMQLTTRLGLAAPHYPPTK